MEDVMRGRGREGAEGERRCMQGREGEEEEQLCV